MPEYGFSLTLIFPYSGILYAVEVFIICELARCRQQVLVQIFLWTDLAFATIIVVNTEAVAPS